MCMFQVLLLAKLKNTAGPVKETQAHIFIVESTFYKWTLELLYFYIYTVPFYSSYNGSPLHPLTHSFKK